MPSLGKQLASLGALDSSRPRRRASQLPVSAVRTWGGDAEQPLYAQEPSLVAPRVDTTSPEGSASWRPGRPLRINADLALYKARTALWESKR